MSVTTKSHAPHVSTDASPQNGAFVPSSAFRPQTTPNGDATKPAATTATEPTEPTEPTAPTSPTSTAPTAPKARISAANADLVEFDVASTTGSEQQRRATNAIEEVTESNPWMTELELLAASPTPAETDRQVAHETNQTTGPVFPSNVSAEAALALDQKLLEIEVALKEQAQLLGSKNKRQREPADDARDDALVGLEPATLPASWLIEGDPSPRIKIMTCSPEGGLLSGIWTCRPATFRFEYATFDETVHIISGVAEVRIGDEITHLRPGSIAYFPKGASSVWTVHEPIHKYFVQRNSNRGVRKLRNLLQRFRKTEQGGLG
jgi:uncharacterized cupin superfamily protein